MAEEKETQSVSLDEYNKLKADFQAQGEKLDKLEKIFEDRQTKVFDKNGAISKDALLKTLGLQKEAEKTELQVVSEKFTELVNTVEQLQKDIKAKDEKLALNDKKAKVLEAAKPYNFIDVNDVLAIIDLNNDDIEGQLKAIAENKKHWIKPKESLGGAFGQVGKNPADLEEQLQDAIKRGDVASQIALKRQIYERQK